MNLTTLQCIFTNAMALFSLKKAAGVTCNLNLEYIAKAYNYMLLADASINKGCDITPDILDEILYFQNAELLTIQLCC